MLEVAVLADDLTGAADCGIAFAAAGLDTFVAFGEAPPPAGAEVVSVDTDSRREGEAEAVRRARAATERARGAGARAVERIEPGIVERTILRGYRALVRSRDRPPADRRLRHQPPRRRARAVRSR